MPLPPEVIGEIDVTRVRANGADFTIARHRDVAEGDMAPLVVPDGRYLILGDFRNNARDGRFYGTTPRESLIGPVRPVYFSIAVDSWDVRWDRVGFEANAWLNREPTN